MQKIVKVLNIQFEVEKEKRAGGTYNCTILTYDDGGETREIAIATAFLDTQLALKRALAAVEVGDAVELTLEKKGMYWNLMQLAPAVAQKAPAGGRKAPAKAQKTPVPFVNNAIGMQVGNALSNAALLLAHGQAKGTLEEVAIQVLFVGEKLKKQLEDGVFKFEAKEEPEAPKAVIVEKDIPFGT